VSTIFEVYPKLARVPSFAEVLDLSTRRLRAFLRECGIAATPAITVELRAMQPDIALPLDLAAPLRWPADAYAWFTVPPADGGTDAYFEALDELAREYWAELLSRDERVRDRKVLVEACLANGYRWAFRRSMGQPATIAVAYGLLAASLAELTEGFIFSDDGSWDYQRFPATAEEFYMWYFRPAMALSEDKREWAERCFGYLAEELTG
jgi:hypothetical protein